MYLTLASECSFCLVLDGMMSGLANAFPPLASRQALPQVPLLIPSIPYLPTWESVVVVLYATTQQTPRTPSQLKLLTQYCFVFLFLRDAQKSIQYFCAMAYTVKSVRWKGRNATYIPLPPPWAPSPPPWPLSSGECCQSAVPRLVLVRLSVPCPLGVSPLPPRQSGAQSRFVLKPGRLLLTCLPTAAAGSRAPVSSGLLSPALAGEGHNEVY